MDCKKAEKLLVDYLYQELSPENTLEIEKHLETCNACARTLENWRGIHRGFQRSNDIPQPAPFLKTRILAAAREELERKPGLAERMMVWLKPALVLPVLIFALLVLLFLPSKQTEMARARKPAVAESPAPAPSVAKTAQPQQDEETGKMLRSLGYTTGGKEAEKQSTEQYTDKLKRKAEADRAGSRDQAARGGIVSEKKAGSYNEATPPPPKEAEPTYETAPQQMTQQESVQAEQQRKEMSPAAARPAPAPGSAPQVASQIAKDNKADLTNANFQKAQTLFKNNDLPQGKNAAEEAIRTDKDSSLASQFHEAGRQYQSQGQPQQAIVQYNLVLNNYPDYPGSPDVLMRLGESYEQIGEYGKAIRTYQQLARIPSMQKAAENKMRTLSKKKEVQEQLRSLGYVDKN